MKHLLLIISLFCFKVASADIVVKKDTVGGYYYCDIQPFVCDECVDTANRLSFTLFDHNAIDHAQIYWCVRHDNSFPEWVGNLDLSDTDYADYRDVNTDVDSFAKAKWIYDYISANKPQIIPIE